MKKDRIYYLMRKPAIIIALLITSYALTGCMPEYVPPDYSSYKWPKPPQMTRVKLTKIITTDLDIRQRTFSEQIFGEQATFSFIKPHGVAADNDGNIFVTDTYRKTVYILNEKTGSIETLFNPMRWRTPFHVAIDEQNNMLAVSDYDKVYVFDWKSKKFLFPIGRPGEFKRPNGIAFDPQRKVLYISDTQMSEIYSYDYKGRKISTVVTSGTQPGKIYFPTAIATDSDGNLYVVDTMNFRVQTFGPDGEFLNTFGQHGDYPGMFARPKGIAVSKDGLIFVTDADYGNFQIFDKEGKVYLFIGSVGTQPARFALPTGVFIDSNNVLYVVDQVNRRVQVFQVFGDEYYAAHPDEAAKFTQSTDAEAGSGQEKFISKPTGEASGDDFAPSGNFDEDDF